VVSASASASASAYPVPCPHPNKQAMMKYGIQAIKSHVVVVVVVVVAASGTNGVGPPLWACGQSSTLLAVLTSD